MKKQLDTQLKQALAELQLTWILNNHEVELADAARCNRTSPRLLNPLSTKE